MTRNFFDFSLSELAAECVSRGHPAVHAKTMFRQAYKNLHPNPWLDPNLSRDLSQGLAASLSTADPIVAASHQSGYDNSVKFLIQLADGSQVESVLMPEARRLTLCLSSQVGCAQGCVFCHTGRMGLKRNLTAGEIVGQLMFVDRWLQQHPEWLASVHLPARQRVKNLVFMGMGEPLDNVEAVAKVLAIVTDPYGLGLGLARISVSTAGHLDGLEALLAKVPRARIALSVHCVDSNRRSKIMPINRRWPLADVVARLKLLQSSGGASVMLQYTMIAGVNDSLEDAAELAALTQGLDAKVNLIPLNPVSASRLVPPSAEQIQAFRDVLHHQGIRVMVRYSKGQDIAAACGQLIVQAAPKTPELAVN